MKAGFMDYSHAKRTFYLMMALLLTTAGGMAAGNAHAAGLFFNGAGENETEAAADLFEDDLDEFTEEGEEIPAFPVEDVSIPPVVERPLGVDDGVKIIVNSFVLDDARDLPQHGIFLEEIYQALNENITATGEGVSIGRLQETAESHNRLLSFPRPDTDPGGTASAESDRRRSTFPGIRGNTWSDTGRRQQDVQR